MVKMKKFIFIALSFLYVISFCSSSFADSISDPWKSLAIQHNGRVKPFDTFSREILKKVYGKKTFQDRKAVDVILSWLLIPEYWEKTPFLLIEQSSLKKSLGLNPKMKRFSPEELKSNRAFAIQLTQMRSLRDKDEELEGDFKHLESLETRLTLYEAIKSSWLLKITAPKEGYTWLSPLDMKGESQDKFQQAIQHYIQLVSNQNQNQIQTQNQGVSLGTLELALEDFKRAAFGANPNKWYQELRIQTEIFYNQFNPFWLAFLFYLFFLFAVVFCYWFKKPKAILWFMPLFALAFANHSLGLLLRSYIMARPPVSNMYETVVWVPWVAVVAGLVFYFKKSTLPFLASVVASCLCLFLVSISPQVLDGTFQPLEAVLRSSFWLSTHVLIITMSYSFFFLSFVMGDFALLSYIFSRKNKLALPRKMSQPIYRCVQWGVFLLTTGTILGAIWADYSWGRFWGWDPKESWALITLLSYLALLHGRFVGWVKPLSLSICSVLMFFVVIMAWYGVNFILGKGLHSYGFGAGGVEYMAGFFALHLLLCGIVFWKYRSQSKTDKLAI